MKKVFYSVLAVCAFSVMACQKENAEPEGSDPAVERCES